MKNMKEKIEASNRASIIRKSIAKAEALVPDLSTGSVMNSFNDNIAIEIEGSQHSRYINENNSNTTGLNETLSIANSNNNNNINFSQGVPVGQVQEVLSPTSSATAGIELQYSKKPSFDNNNNDRNSRYNHSSSKRSNKKKYIDESMYPGEYRYTDKTGITRILAAQRLYGFPGSGGSLCGNFIQYCLNEHPLFSICFAHIFHPFTKFKRLIVFFSTLSLCFVLTVILLDSFYVDNFETCEDGCNNISNNRCGTNSGGNEGMDTAKYNSKCKYYSPYLLSAICGAISMVYGLILRFVGECPCLQGHGFIENHLLCNFLKGKVDSISNYTIYVFGILGVAMLIYGSLRAVAIGLEYTIIMSFIASKILSFAYWFLWAILLFALYYTRDRDYYYRSCEEKEEEKMRESIKSGRTV